MHANTFKISSDILWGGAQCFAFKGALVLLAICFAPLHSESFWVARAMPLNPSVTPATNSHAKESRLTTFLKDVFFKGRNSHIRIATRISSYGLIS